MIDLIAAMEIDLRAVWDELVSVIEADTLTPCDDFNSLLTVPLMRIKSQAQNPPPMLTCRSRTWIPQREVA
jgi:hypothetical protein